MTSLRSQIVILNADPVDRAECWREPVTNCDLRVCTESRVRGPKARIHTSLGQRSRFASDVRMRAESPSHLFVSAAVWAGLSALGFSFPIFLGRCPRLAWVAPLAHRHTELSGHALGRRAGGSRRMPPGPVTNCDRCASSPFLGRASNLEMPNWHFKISDSTPPFTLMA